MLAALLLAAPAAALAQSAGNQQYVDPLAGNSTPSTGSSHSTPSQGTSSPSSSGPASSGATQTSSGSAPASTSQGTATTASAASGTGSSASQSSASQSSSSSATLPRTGLDLGPALAVAGVLLAAGLALRLVTRPD